MSGDESVFGTLESDAAFSEPHGDPYTFISHSGGLTKRELFAAVAMQGCLSGRSYEGKVGWVKDAIVSDAVKLADALIAELAKDSDEQA